MTKTMIALAAGLSVLAASAFADDNKTARHGDPMQASASMRPAATAPVRYDTACRTQFGFGSIGYQDCLQRLPATALISR